MALQMNIKSNSIIWSDINEDSEMMYGTTAYENPIFDNEFGMSLEEAMMMDFSEKDLIGYSSIQDDVEKITASDSQSSSSNGGSISDIVKPEIRNVDCMWSSANSNNCSVPGSNGNNNCNGNNNSNSAASSYSESSAVPPAIVTGCNAMLIKCEPKDEPEDDQEDEEEEENTQNCVEIKSNKMLPTIKTTPTIKIPSKKLKAFQSSAPKMMHNAELHIPPGASLLRKSNNFMLLEQLHQQLYEQQLKQLENRRMHSNGFLRPDTPQSTTSYENENLSEFRHNVDLRACVMGSNNISLTNSADAIYIDHLSRELQNTSKERIDLLPYRINSMEPLIINDVLDVISEQSQSQQHQQQQQTTAATVADVTSATAATLSPPATTATSSDCDSDDGDCSMVDSASLDGNNSLFMRHISDHSYTRCNEMETNLETPSDSDEEIDVVSLNDKKLPTNPSDRDRRALQTKVAHKISNGAGFVSPRRRGRIVLPYTPVKSVANSRFPSPSSTPYQSVAGVAVATVYSPESLSQSSRSSSSSSSDCTSPPATGIMDSKNRKSYYVNDSMLRMYAIKGNKQSYSSSALAAKKSRVKKVQNSHKVVNSSSNSNSNISSHYASTMSQIKQEQPTLGANNNSNNSMLKRQLSLDEADTIEKRNLHNDMERQRRIGLKNLFEALKKQIPNIRDKERAPKVNILREAAKLCMQLTSEETELNLKRQQLKAKQKQQQELLARLRLSKKHSE